MAYLWKNCEKRSPELLPDPMPERLVEFEYHVLGSLAWMDIRGDSDFVPNHRSSPKTTAAFDEDLSEGFLVRYWRQPQTL